MGDIVGLSVLGLCVIACFAVLLATKGKNLGAAVGSGALGFVLLLALLGIFAFGGEVSVPVKSIGVPQAFGAVSGSVMGPGVHWTWQPWLDVTNVDETIQSTDFQQGSGIDGTQACNGALPVRIGGQQTACAVVKLKWQIKPSAAEALFKDYANQGDLMTVIERSVVIQDLEKVVNEVMGDYNPITDVSSVTGTNGTQSLFTTFSPQILSNMQRDIGDQVSVLSVTMPTVAYSTQVEAKLNAIQQAFADYAIASENVKVNTERALAIAKLGTPTLAQLIAQCLSEAAGNNPGQCIPGATDKLAITQSPAK